MSNNVEKGDAFNIYHGERAYSGPYKCVDVGEGKVWYYENESATKLSCRDVGDCIKLDKH